jgi:hypothetical protein
LNTGRVLLDGQYVILMSHISFSQASFPRRIFCLPSRAVQQRMQLIVRSGVNGLLVPVEDDEA